MQIQKLKLGQQNNDKGSINLAGANKKATGLRLNASFDVNLEIVG